MRPGNRAAMSAWAGASETCLNTLPPQRIPARTALVCITLFAIFTEVQVFDFIKYRDARQVMLDVNSASIIVPNGAREPDKLERVLRRQLEEQR